MNVFTISGFLFAPADESAGGGDAPTGTLVGTRKSLAQTARQTADQIKSAANDAARRTKDEAQRIASEKKEQTAQRIGAYGSAIHKSAESLEEEDPNIAWLTHRTADKVQRVADYLRNNDFRGLKQDAEDFARRHPAAFFGGMIVAGLLVGNMLKASRRELEDDNLSSSADSDLTSDSESGDTPESDGAPELGGSMP